MSITKLFCKYGLPVFLFISITQCSTDSGLRSGQGYMDVEGGKVWYKIVGDGDDIPIILLHGGPGFPSYYLNPLSALGSDRPVVFYDQLGCGRSDQNIDTSLMTIDHFVEQLEKLRTELGIEEFYLYGQSWGSMLGIDYYRKYPESVKAIIFASPALSVSRWINDVRNLIKTLPDSIQVAIQENEDKGTYDDQAYQHAIGVFYQNFLARKLPWDANLDSTFTGVNLELYNYMWGPSEFKSTGTLQNFERENRLREINVPTLYICGEYDEARPETIKYFQSLTPGSKFVMIRDAAHITMHDNPIQDIAAIRRFLKEVEDK